MSVRHERSILIYPEKALSGESASHESEGNALQVTIHSFAD
jgi:hypothetical protein